MRNAAEAVTGRAGPVQSFAASLAAVTVRIVEHIVTPPLGHRVTSDTDVVVELVTAQDTYASV